MKKIIISLILAFLIAFSIPISSVLASEYDDGGIAKELQDVDLSVYESENITQLITLSEVGFNTSDFKLIVYVYNAGGFLLNQNTASNKINVAILYNDEHKPISYANFSLQYISKTEDNSIYKFAIVDDDNVLKDSSELQNTLYNERRYDVVGVQLLNVGNNLGKDYKVEKTYVFSGTADKLTLKGIKSIELEVHPIWYRTKSAINPFSQHQINSVYFSVPNDYLKDNYQLDAVKAEWYEYKTEPIAVIEDKSLFTALEKMKGKKVNAYNKAVPTLYYNQEYIGGSLLFDWSYNLYEGSLFQPHISSNVCESLNLLFNDKKDAIISSERLTKYIYTYNSSSNKGYLPIKNGTISADLFQDDVDEGRTKGYNVATIHADQKFDLLSYSDTHNLWDTYLDYGFLNLITGNIPTDESIKGVDPIYPISKNDVKDIYTMSSNLLVDSEFCEELKNFVTEQENRTTFLFRFAVTDYKSYKVTNWDYSPEDVGYVAWETVFLDFDIIHLEFYNSNERLVVPIVADPIDIIPSITPPPVWDNKWILYGIITVLVLLGVGVIYSIIKKGAK